MGTLEIVNIEKLYKKDVGGWRISRVETIPSAYIIHLLKPGGERHQLNIERIPVWDEYEMWCWKPVGTIGPLPNSKPERLMVNKGNLSTMERALTVINLLLM
jgi:hypothetical protein